MIKPYNRSIHPGRIKRSSHHHVISTTSAKPKPICKSTLRLLQALQWLSRKVLHSVCVWFQALQQQLTLSTFDGDAISAINCCRQP
jgi:hypothetical protein